MPDDAKQKVNCRVQAIANGGRRLVFTLDGSDKCVGEVRVHADSQYLLVISELFSHWVSTERGHLILPSAIRQILNGHSANQG